MLRVPVRPPSVPTSSSRTFYAGVFVSAAVWIGLGILRPVHVYDDGIPVVGAMRVLAGELPFRDFYTNYGPGQFYLTAAAFRLFGTSLLTERLLSVALRALIVVAAMALLGRLVPRPWVLAGGAVVLAWAGMFAFYGYPAFPALLCLLLSVAAMARASRTDGPHLSGVWAFAAGGLAGLAGLIRQDFGVYIVAGTLIWFAARVWRVQRQGRQHVSGHVAAIVAFLAGAGLVVLPPAIGFAEALGWSRLFHDLFVWPHELTRDYRGWPWPWPWDLPSSNGPAEWTIALSEALPFSAVLIVYAGVFAGLVARFARSEAVSGADWLRLHLWILGVILINQARHRSDLVHLAPTWIVAIVLLVELVWQWIREVPAPRWLRMAGVLVLFLGLSLRPIFEFAGSTVPSLINRPPAARLLPRGGPIPLDPGQVEAVRYVTSRTRIGERIFVGNARHDRVVLNDVIFYFLADRPVASRHHHFDPGLTTTRAVQREIIEALEQGPVRYLVTYAGADHADEPNGSAQPQATDLDRRIRERYVLDRRFGAYSVYQRIAEPQRD